MLRIEPGVAGLEVSMLPLCYAAPHHLESLVSDLLHPERESDRKEGGSNP